MRMRGRILGLVISLTGSPASRLAGVLTLALAAAPAAHAQERFGSIAGTVTDSQQSAVPGATITVTNTANGASRTVVSTADGSYRLADRKSTRLNSSH